MKRENPEKLKNLKRGIGLLIMLVLLMSIGTQALADYVGVRRDCRARTGPGYDYSVAWSLSKGETVYCTDRTSYDSSGRLWYSVKQNGRSGWVIETDLKGYSEVRPTATPKPTKKPTKKPTQKPTQKPSGKKYARVTGGRTRLRSGPGLDYETIEWLAEGEVLTYLGSQRYDSEGRLWYKLRSGENLTGWSSSRYITLTNDGTDRRPTPTPWSWGGTTRKPSGRCTHCLGSGECGRCDGYGRETCSACGGRGECRYCTNGRTSRGGICSVCNGVDECTTCGGWGLIDCPLCGGTGVCTYCR